MSPDLNIHAAVKAALVSGAHPLDGALDRDNFGRKIIDLNAKAMRAHWGVSTMDLNKMNDRAASYTYDPTDIVGLDDAALLKALNYVIYQLDEGREFTDTVLFQRLERAALFLTNRIINSLPAYTQAKWKLA